MESQSTQGRCSTLAYGAFKFPGCRGGPSFIHYFRTASNELLRSVSSRIQMFSALCVSPTDRAVLMYDNPQSPPNYRSTQPDCTAVSIYGSTGSPEPHLTASIHSRRSCTPFLAIINSSATRLHQEAWQPLRSRLRTTLVVHSLHIISPVEMGPNNTPARLRGLPDSILRYIGKKLQDADLTRPSRLQ